MVKFKLKLKTYIYAFLPEYVKNKRAQNFSAEIKMHTPILIYQMGKVGSSSIFYSILKHYNGKVLHTHQFHKNHPSEKINFLYNNYLNEKTRIKVISLIREPISRNLSAFFQNFEFYVGIPFKRNFYSPSELLKIFIEKFNHDGPLFWFDSNIAKNFNINIYDYAWPNEDYIIINKNNIELLVIKHDLNNVMKELIIGDFVGIHDFKISNRNMSSNKDYHEIYMKLKNRQLPEWYIEKMINTKFVRHFYKKEIDDIRNKWNKG